jgi:hypothetical protein
MIQFGRLLFVLALLAAPSLRADDEADKALKEAHRLRTQQVVERVHVFAGTDRSPKSERRLAPDPVLRYTDPTRKTYESGLWIWGEGRPSAIMAIEYYPMNPIGQKWLVEIASLSADRITADCDSHIQWTADKPGLDLKPIPESPKPADRPAGRLIQMKQLQRRFAAVEFSIIGGRIELRPLATPIHRYEDKAAGVIDGAILSFGNGTNPEVLLTLEAHGANGVADRWQYSLAQMSGAEAAVELDGKEIWRRPNADPPAIRDSYVNAWISDEE